MSLGWMRPGGLLFAATGAALIGAGLATDSGGETGSAALITGGTFLFIGLTWWGIGVFLNPRAVDDAELERFGRPSEATVLEAERVGHEPDGTPRLKLKLHVTPNAERPFKATKTITTHLHPTPGDPVRVKFDPNNRKNFILA